MRRHQSRTRDHLRRLEPLTHVLEKRISNVSENSCDMYNTQGDVEGPFEQPTYFPIGQWPTKSTSISATTSITLVAHNTVRRTGTDLQAEEMNIGTVRSRTNPNCSAQAEVEAAGAPQPSSAEAFVTTHGLEHPPTPEYIQYEWLRVLIAMILLLITETILMILIRLEDMVVLWRQICISVAIALVSTILYTGAFVVLKQYHGVIGKTIRKYIWLSLRLQRSCLRLLVYVYLCGIIGFFGFRILFPF